MNDHGTGPHEGMEPVHSSPTAPLHDEFGGYGPSLYYGNESGAMGVFNLNRWARLVSRKWNMLLGGVLFALATAVILLMNIQPVFQASSLIEMSVRRPRIAGHQGALIADDVPWQSEEVFNTRIEKFKGPILRGMANVRFEAMREKEGLSPSLKSAVRGAVRFAMLRRSRLLRITVENTDPRAAAVFANAYAQATEAWSMEENKRESDNAVAWLTTQSETQRFQLERADVALMEFRSTNRMDILETEKKSLESSMLEFNQALVHTESEMVLAQDIFTVLQKLENDPQSLGKAPDSIPRLDEIKATHARWVAARTERDSLLTRYTAKHPSVEEKEEVVMLLEKELQETIRRARQTAESNLELLGKQAASLRDKIRERLNEASALERTMVERKAQLSSLERERDACDVAYRGILTRMEEARLSADENTATVKIVEPAETPKSPFKPRKGRFLAIALLLGLAAGFGLAWVTDRMEDFVGNAADIEFGIGLKILGVVPRVLDVDREELLLFTLREQGHHFTEAFAGIRGLLESALTRERSRSILITSTIPGEGKSIIASNLAILLAKSGYKTLLIDFDLRRPQLGRVHDMPESQMNLTEALKNQDRSMLDRLPFPSACPLLDVIANRKGTMSASPAELMATPFVRGLIEWAGQRYERIVIDSPPFGLISDSMILASLAQGCIVVCRPGQTRKRATRHAIHHFRKSGAHILGAIVNDVDFNKGLFRGNYEMYHGHGYYEYYAAERNQAARVREGGIRQAGRDGVGSGKLRT